MRRGGDALRGIVVLAFTLLIGCKNEGESAPGSSLAPPRSSAAPVSSPLPPPSPGFATRLISIGSRELVIEIADTDARREHGLMHRQSLGRDEGMLFIFEGEAVRSFWMRNTRIPLSIAYIDSRKRIIDIQDMQPAPDSEPYPRQYPSRGPAMYALEMNLGWFARNNVKIGDKLALR